MLLLADGQGKAAIAELFSFKIICDLCEGEVRDFGNFWVSLAVRHVSFFSQHNAFDGRLCLISCFLGHFCLHFLNTM